MRILLKISWDALKGEKEFGIDSDFVIGVVEKIKELKQKNIEIALVVWGWNIYRWWDLIKSWVDDSDSHNLSMLWTVFNWVVLKNFLEKVWLESVVMDPNWVNFVEEYSKTKAREYLENNKIVICTGWTWSPYFTTDSGWVLRASELKCDMLIKATKVDWIYDSDPVTNTDAKILKELSYNDVISKDLKIMDPMSVVLAKNNKMPIKVVSLDKKWAILRAVLWEEEGSQIK